MKNKLNKLAVWTAALLGSAVMAEATITVSQVSATGTGPSTWTYEATFVNSTLNVGDFFTLNDFGPATPLGLPAGWSFTEALTGPNSLPAADNAGVLNATFTWIGGPGVVISPNPATTVGVTFELFSPGSFSPVLSDYTSLDQATTGAGIAGTDSRVIGAITVPSAVPVPDGGTTVALLGVALMGIAGLRRRTMA